MPRENREVMNQNHQQNNSLPEGILLVNKPKGKTSFSLVAALRRKLGVKKIGHTGTLDPFATGLVVLLVGKNYTRLSNQFLEKDKEYIARLHLGITTDTYDTEGKVTKTSEHIPSHEDIVKVIQHFQGKILQTPPMFSAKKIQGKKLYELARKGISIERKPVEVDVATTIIHYEYPFLDLHVKSSKGTYIRSLAYDIGELLGCGAHLAELQRTRSGEFTLSNSIDGSLINEPNTSLQLLKWP